jgi:acyl carrier protein
MLEVVAEKTGYPADMLNLEMDLEADLGVDSIKRVEILSTMYEKAPSLPEVDAAEMAKLRTLGQIVDYMDAQMPAGAPPAAPAAAAAPAVDLHSLMLEVVAEKTGYPADMLNLEMDLEADLGVDSIKRVEILSTMYEKAPSLPEVDAAEMAKLRTLGQIVDYMDGQTGGAPTPVASKPASAPAAEIPSPKVGRYPLRVVDAPAFGFALSGLCSAQKVLVTDDQGGVAPLLAAKLADRGIAAEVVTEVSADADAVLFLGGLRDVADIDHAKAVNREAFLAAKSVAARFAEQGGVFVTVQDTGGDFGLSGSARAWLAGLSGLVKTAAQEWPQASLRAIDIERGDRGAEDVATAIVEELLAGGDEVEVGLRADGARTTLESFHQDVTAGEAVVNQKSVILASGGARGVTAATLIALAGETGARFVLLGRTPLEDEPPSIANVEGDAALKQALLSEAKAAGEAITPAELGKRVSRILANREVRATIAAIKAAGGDARYLVADVKNADAIRAGLEPIRADWGPVTGIVHGAGLLADKLIAEKTEDQFDLVFDTKVDGLRSLLSVTRDDDLEVLCLFSSVAARCGNQGQCDYAMANEVLNKVAAAERRRRGGKLVVKSLNWGPWEGGMVTPALKARFEALGVPLIPLATGAQMLVDELTGAAREQTEICLGGEPRPEALLSEGRDEATVHEILVDRASYPYLDGHRVKGEAVVPVVLVLEWFARAARAHRPELHFIGCSDVKVLKGVRLPDFDTAGHVFRVRSRQSSNGSGVELAVELIGPDDVKHYSATASLSPAPATPKGAAPSIGALEAHDGEVYGGVLFHGPEFQVIRELDGVSTDGITGELVGATSLGWHGQSWQTDPALLDGGFQLALLWTKHMLGGASLPTGVDRLRIYRSGLPEGELRCVLVGKKAAGDKAVCDITFVDADGRIVAELTGVTTYVLPGSRSASAAPRVRA